jgi:hypothetical protein
VESVVDAQSLYVVGRRGADDAEYPLEFATNLLPAPEQDAAWLTTRLKNYANLEKLRFVLKNQGYSPNLLSPLIHTLQWPAFTGHLTEVCATFTEHFAANGLLREALMLTLAVAEGPFPEDVRRQFRIFAERIAGTEDPTELSAAG